MRAAYRITDPLVAQAELGALARGLDLFHPSAAASLREGLAETPHHRQARRAPDPGPNALVDQHHRIDDRDLS
jgi:hypothetical protein